MAILEVKDYLKNFIIIQLRWWLQKYYQPRIWDTDLNDREHQSWKNTPKFVVIFTVSPWTSLYTTSKPLGNEINNNKGIIFKNLSFIFRFFFLNWLLLFFWWYWVTKSSKFQVYKWTVVHCMFTAHRFLSSPHIWPLLPHLNPNIPNEHIFKWLGCALHCKIHIYNLILFLNISTLKKKSNHIYPYRS